MKIVSSTILLLAITVSSYGRQSFIHKDFSLLDMRVSASQAVAVSAEEDQSEKEEFPDPNSVLYKSLMIPGWGQIVNRQAWKVPIIYGVFAGIGYYTYSVHQDYTDYRAAFYNTQRGEDTDFKFGPTPEFLEGVNQDQLRQNRNTLRNRRDRMFVVMLLAHGLNALDAYVFAHMRSFDVSDDLSARATITPDLLVNSAPGVSLKIQLNRK